MLGLVIGFLVNLFEGFVFMMGWNWHVAPLFHVTMSYWTAVGIVVLVGWVTFSLPVMAWKDMVNVAAQERESGVHALFGRNIVTLGLAAQALLFLWVAHLLS